MDKFGGIDNIYALLEGEENFNVKMEEGEIELILSYQLPNKKKINHKGTL